MLLAAAGPAVRILVFDLDADDRSAVFPEQPVQLRAGLLIPDANRGQVRRVIDPCCALLQNPVRKPSVPHLGVIPRADPDYQKKPMLRANLREGAQVPLAAPVKLSFDLFVMYPQYIGRDDVHPRCLHLEQFLLPLLARIAAEMEFSHHRKPGLAIEGQIAVIEPQHVS